MYRPLAKIFHIDKDGYSKEFEKRFNSDFSVHFNFLISNNPALNSGSGFHRTPKKS